MADVAWLTPATIAAIGTGLMGFGRWALRFWEGERQAARVAAAAAAAAATAASVAGAARREMFEAQLASAARADGDRMIAALLESARGNAALAGKVDALTGKLDTLGGQVFETISSVSNPVVSGNLQRHRAAGRVRTDPMGYPQMIREPRPGSHHDSED